MEHNAPTGPARFAGPKVYILHQSSDFSLSLISWSNSRARSNVRALGARLTPSAATSTAQSQHTTICRRVPGSIAVGG
jgi:hypothetical protein